jgi:hypothetical protein
VKTWILKLIKLLAVAAVVLAVIVGKEHQQIAQLKKQLASATATAEQAKQQLASASKKRLQPESSPANKPVDSASIPVPSVFPQAGAAGATNFMANLAGMMKNPQMKEVVRSGQKMTLERTYASLFKNLNLSSEQQDAFADLLLARQMALMDAGLAAFGGKNTDVKQSIEETKVIKADYDKKIQDSLGPQAYPAFQQYEETQQERAQVQMFKGALPAAEALTDQQEEGLVAVMREERKALPASSLFNNQTPDPSQFTEENVNETIQQLGQLQQRYADRAGAILTPEQLEQFTKFQQQWSTMQAAGMKMFVQMYGNKSTPQPPVANQGQTP